MLWEIKVSLLIRLSVLEIICYTLIGATWYSSFHKVYDLYKQNLITLCFRPFEFRQNVWNELTIWTYFLCFPLHCLKTSFAVVAGMKKPNDHAEPTKVES